MSRKTYPGDIKLAREQLKLADEIREHAFDLDPTLRPKVLQMATDSATTTTKTPAKVQTMSRNSTRRYYAFDAEGRDLSGAYSALYQLLDHVVGARDGQFDFDQETYNRHLATANDCLKPGAADEASENKRDKETAEAADSALALDTLFQRPSFLTGGKLKRRPTSAPRKSTPVNAHALENYDVDSLFQVNR